MLDRNQLPYISSLPLLRTKDEMAGLQIISRLAPVKLSGQTYLCLDISHFWPDKLRLHLIAIKVPLPPFYMMFKYETSTFSKYLLYMNMDLNAGNVERMVQQNQYHICAYYYCFRSTLPSLKSVLVTKLLLAVCRK